MVPNIQELPQDILAKHFRNRLKYDSNRNVIFLDNNSIEIPKLYKEVAELNLDLSAIDVKRIILDIAKNNKFILAEEYFSGYNNTLFNILPNLMETLFPNNNKETQTRLFEWMIESARRFKNPGSEVYTIPQFVGPYRRVNAFLGTGQHFLNFKQAEDIKPAVMSRTRKYFFVSILSLTQPVSNKRHDKLRELLYSNEVEIACPYTEQLMKLPKSFVTLGMTNESSELHNPSEPRFLGVISSFTEKRTDLDEYKKLSREAWKLAWSLS